ncbi:hypothetical protein Tco_0351739 [Tanacetum coccineum]
MMGESDPFLGEASRHRVCCHGGLITCLPSFARVQTYFGVTRILARRAFLVCSHGVIIPFSELLTYLVLMDQSGVRNGTVNIVARDYGGVPGIIKEANIDFWESCCDEYELLRRGSQTCYTKYEDSRVLAVHLYQRSHGSFPSFVGVLKAIRILAEQHDVVLAAMTDWIL